MKRMILIPAAAVLLAACGGGSPQVKLRGDVTAQEPLKLEMSHMAANSLDYKGTYEGTLPAADCPGIETRITLAEDGTYEKHERFIERDAAFDETGRYKVNGSVLVLYPGGTELGARYKVEENRLRQLDAEGQEIKGELADHYLLKKL